jgi:hypothetical protein
MKGEKSIKILAPCRYKVETEADTNDDIYTIKGFILQ